MELVIASYSFTLFGKESYFPILRLINAHVNFHLKDKRSIAEVLLFQGEGGQSNNLVGFYKVYNHEDKQFKSKYKLTQFLMDKISVKLFNKRASRMSTFPLTVC